MKSRGIKCAVCGDKIDRGDCQNKFGVLTLYDNAPSPRKVERKYLCRLHSAMIAAEIGHIAIKRYLKGHAPGPGGFSPRDFGEGSDGSGAGKRQRSKGE